MYENLLARFLRYVKFETRSDATSKSIPSTPSQIEFAKMLANELKEIGLSEVTYQERNGFVTAVLPSNIQEEVPTIGFIAHMDTADFNATNVQPQLIANYDGVSDIALDADGQYRLTPKDFPNLKNYVGETLVTTDGTTLLGADDKAGIAEIMTAMDYLVQHPEVKHGTVKVAFGPDEEIGSGADHFDVEAFAADFAYTMDGGPVGELEYETFNAAQAEITIQGKNVHPGTAKDKMINALQVAIDFHDSLPKEEVPEKTEGREGFFHLFQLDGNPEEATMTYIVRDHDRAKFEERKEQIRKIKKTFNQKFGQERVNVEITDQYYNMSEIIEKDLSIVELAKRAMENLNIKPIIEPVRGGTDGSKLSFMGLPTPNIFAGGENMHGRFEFVSVQSMEKATSVIVEICKINTDSGTYKKNEAGK